jgi:hypothetical protein
MAYKVKKIRKSYTNSQMKKQVKFSNKLLKKYSKNFAQSRNTDVERYNKHTVLQGDYVEK